jgi:hypothetical protein
MFKYRKFVINVRQITFKVNFLNFRSWSGYGDELALGAAWLAKATGKNYYLKKAKAFFNECVLCDKNDFSWDNKAAGTKVLLLELTGNKKDAPRNLLTLSCTKLSTHPRV